ncbi:hypothetical protein BCR34DRAFT_509097, partial [Clohesyomyces aquaticus]
MPNILILVFCLFQFLCVASDAWHGFANNLATDLAPILQPFWEQVTKQFLSESISQIDNLIFTMAPMGVLTAIVSVIRVCGGIRMKAFIGTAQESPGTAEVELCSSTGRDVCEMYHHDTITRIFGKAKLIELVHDPKFEDFYCISPLHDHPSAGLYTFRDNLQTEKGGISKRGRSFISSTTESEIAPFYEHEDNNPNLRLNIIASLGVVLQGGMIAFAVVVTRYLRWSKNGNVPPPPVWSLYSAVAGTTLLCLGMFFRSALIESSTINHTFVRQHTPTWGVIYWIQPGDQVLGDQMFDSFIYHDRARPLQVSASDARWTILSVSFTFSGFIFQFIGLRGLHASISIFQLGSVLIMSVLRALLR